MKEGSNSIFRKPFLFLLFLFLSCLLISGCGKTETSSNDKVKETVKDKAVFEQIGYYKIKLDSGANDRSFTVYTDETDKTKLIEYGRSMMNTPGGFTYVHFYSNKDSVPDITLIKDPGKAYFPEKTESRFFVYQKSPNGNEFIWDGEMSDNEQIDS